MLGFHAQSIRHPRAYFKASFFKKITQVVHGLKLVDSCSLLAPRLERASKRQELQNVLTTRADYMNNVIVVKATQYMDNGIGFSNICQKLIA